MKNSREDFLSESWLPYPQADDLWVPASEARPGKTTWVCGRLESLNGKRGTLGSDGVSLSFSFSDEATWLREQRKSMPFETELLCEGDLLCLELTWEKAAPTAQKVLLLAPSQKVFHPNPSFNVERSRSWDKFLEEVRRHFKVHGFIEALTPTLVPSPGTEPFLDPFATDWEWGSQKRELFLPTSPEFHLKKMLVLGWTKIFEFKTCFRNGELSGHHQPEFLMLEWYRAYATLDRIADDVEALLLHVQMALRPRETPFGLKRTTMKELFAQAFDGFELSATTSREDLVALAEKVNVRLDPSDTWDEVFLRLFIEKIESGLGMEGPLLVRGYPPSQAALSRIGADGFADRFEVYWRGLELANAFHELNDPVENERRFLEDGEKKKQLGKRAVPYDKDLVRGLQHGLPPSGGIALGLDRLFMATMELSEIAATRAFPIRDERGAD